MNDVYLYDGDFSSLLALIVEVMKKRIIPYKIYEESTYQISLLENPIYLEVSDKISNIQKLKKVLPKGILGRVYYVYLSDDKNKEMIIYSFIKYAIRLQDKVFYYRRIDSVNEVIKISKRVSGEAHKLKGFLRFIETRNHFFYGKYKSDNNVLPILVKHFKNRFYNENWILYDEGRGYYAVYFKKNVYYLTDDNIQELHLDVIEKEMDVEDLWKSFHKTVSIKERENRKCQMNFMPKKYWNNLLEMDGEI